jgi:hypothetical protein
MKQNTARSGISNFIQSENGYLLTAHPDKTALEATLRAIEGALLCIDEGNTARAAQLLYSALPKDRRPTR